MSITINKGHIRDFLTTLNEFKLAMSDGFHSKVLKGLNKKILELLAATIAKSWK